MRRPFRVFILTLHDHRAPSSRIERGPQLHVPRKNRFRFHRRWRLFGSGGHYTCGDFCTSVKTSVHTSHRPSRSHTGALGRASTAERAEESGAPIRKGTHARAPHARHAPHTSTPHHMPTRPRATARTPPHAMRARHAMHTCRRRSSCSAPRMTRLRICCTLHGSCELSMHQIHPCCLVPAQANPILIASLVPAGSDAA